MTPEEYALEHEPGFLLHRERWSTYSKADWVKILADAYAAGILEGERRAQVGLERCWVCESDPCECKTSS